MFLVTAASLGGIAVIAGSLSIAELCFALAAALAGFMLWNWPRPRYPFGAAGLLGAGAPVLALALLTLLLTDVSPWSLTPLVLIFVADDLSRRLPAGTGLLRQTLQPVYLVLVGSVPGAVAVALAWLTRQPDSLYYQ
jgi:UDP-N-acetylmuramyl pentapeptide phosphotransferase/UDP-N-acetylglucosamine-1-phosphate transferase